MDVAPEHGCLSPSLFIYINGFPGVGKLSVARELQNLIMRSRVVDNHLLIDPCAAVFERDMPEYRPLRNSIRNAVLEAITTNISHPDVTWIFTDSQQSSDPLAQAVAESYRNAAIKRGSLFISVVLTCELEENCRRLVARNPSRDDPQAAYESLSGRKSKLADVNVLKDIRREHELYRWGGENEIELDVTVMDPREAARRIREFAQARISDH